jgi:hypothetical protein
MDQGSLVEMQIEDGKRLIDRLVEEGIPVAAAGWLKEAEDGQWFLYIASPLVDEEGATKAAYRRVNAVIRQMPQPFWIHPLEIKLVEPGSPIARAMRELNARIPGPSPIRYGGAQIGGMSIEGAYIYPPVLASTRQ